MQWYENLRNRNYLNELKEKESFLSFCIRKLCRGGGGGKKKKKKKFLCKRKKKINFL